MLHLEIKDGTIFLSTTDRELMLEAIAFLAGKYPKIETRDQRQVTLFLKKTEMNDELCGTPR